MTVTLLVLFLTVLLHLIDRQVESSSRAEFLWQTKLSSEEEGVETMRGINKGRRRGAQSDCGLQVHFRGIGCPLLEKQSLHLPQLKLKLSTSPKILLENILPAHVAEHYLIQVRGVPLAASGSVS